MKTPRRTWLVALLVGGVAAAIPGPVARADDEMVSNQAIVQLQEEASIEEINAEHGTVVLGAIEHDRTYLLLLPEELDEEAFEQMMEDDDRVDEAELNYRTEAAEGQTESFYLVVDPGAYDDQYAWSMIGTSRAHRSTGGAGVVVALLDTGADIAHPVMNGRLAPGAIDFVDGDDDVSDVGNDLDDDGDKTVDEMVGHGTFMAGIVAKVAPDAGLLIIRVLDSDGAGSAFRIAEGIHHAIDNGAGVINLSLVMEDEHDVLEEALERAAAAGIVVVAAAGNLDRTEPAAFPADVETTIGVASTDADDRKSAFSNYGEHIAISAPGSAVVSAVPGDLYGRWDGTSISTAMTAGAAALVRALAPDATPADVARILGDSAAPLAEDGLGRGRLDVGAAIEDLGGGGPIGDLNGDGSVDAADLILLLGDWGATESPADLDGDGRVDVADLILLLGNWS